MSPALVVPWILSNIIKDKPLLQSALTKRPYMDNDSETAILINVDETVAEPIIQLSFGNTKLVTWTSVPHNMSLHPFSMSLLPALDETSPLLSLDLTLELQGRRYDGLVRIEQTLQLMRTRIPQQGSYSQIDFRRRGLLVNGNPFYVIGLYTGDSDEKHDSPSAWDDPAVSGPGEEQKIAEEITRNREHGLTSIMVYHFNTLPEDVQQRLLDVCHAHGLFLMYPIHVLLKPVAAHETKSDKAWEAVKKIIERWQHHPAILGWYVCDDCTNSWAKHAENSSMDFIYERIKRLDPYHVVVGAIESQQLDIFTKKSQYSQGVSLDVLMFENYVSRLDPNSHFGTAEDPGLDGSLRNGVKDLSGPLPFEALVNCPGPYQLAEGFDPDVLPQEDQASIVYSLSWLSIITARIPHQLYFRRKYVNNSLLSNALGRYAREIHEFASYIIHELPTRKTLDVSFSEGRYKDNFRAALLPHIGEDQCALLIVTHLNRLPEVQSLQFVAEFEDNFLKTHHVALRLRDNASVPLEKGALVDRMESRWGTELYKICDKDWDDRNDMWKCQRKHAYLPVMLFAAVITSVTLFASYFGFQIYRTKQSRASNELALEMTRQSWNQAY